MSNLEDNDAFKIHSVIKRPLGTTMMSMHYLFAENRFVVSPEEFEHCLNRASDLGLVKLLRSGKYRLVRKICDAHMKGLFKKFLVEKTLRTIGSSKVGLGILKKRKVQKERYRRIVPVVRREDNHAGQTGVSKKVRRLIDAVKNIRGIRGDGHRNNTDVSYSGNKHDVNQRNGARSIEFPKLSNEDLLKNCWQEINSVLEAVTDEEFLNLRVLRDQIYAQL